VIKFVSSSANTLQKIFVTMGEVQSSQFLAKKLTQKYNIKTVVPRQDDVEEIIF